MICNKHGFTIANQTTLNEKRQSVTSYKYLIPTTVDGESTRARMELAVEKLRAFFPQIVFEMTDWTPLSDGTRGFYIKVLNPN